MALFPTILACFRGQQIYYIHPFLPFLEGGRFIIFGHLGPYRGAVHTLFSAMVAIFLGRWSYYFRQFSPFSQGSRNILVPPFWLSSEGGRFIGFGHFGRLQRAGDLLFLAALAIFGWRYISHFSPIVAIFKRQKIYYLRRFWACVVAGSFIILAIFRGR